MQVILVLAVAFAGLVWTVSGQADVGVELQKLLNKVDGLGNTLGTGLENVGNEIDNVGNEIDDVGDEIDLVGNEIDNLEVGDVEDELDDLKAEVQSLKSVLQSELTILRTQLEESIENECRHRREEEAAVELAALRIEMQRNMESLREELQIQMNTTLFMLQELKGQIILQLTDSARQGYQERAKIEGTVAGANGSLHEHLQNLSTEVRMLTDTVAQLEGVCNSSCSMEEPDINIPSSCSDLMKLGNPSGYSWHPLAHSGYYRVRNSTGSAVKVYCDMERHCCGNTGGWIRVADLDMTDPSQQCPQGFRLKTDSKRVCVRTEAPGCTSITFPTHGVQYSRVCGQIRGYQEGTPDAFSSYYYNSAATLEGNYLEGVSIMYGQFTRKHIWTFVAARDEVHSNQKVCPCTTPDRLYTGQVPPFIGTDYFCETGAHGSQAQYGRFYHEDPLWDGKGCGHTSTLNTPPWFCKELPHPTTDNIEVRVCTNTAGDEDILIELIELYVQ